MFFIRRLLNFLFNHMQFIIYFFVPLLLPVVPQLPLYISLQILVWDLVYVYTVAKGGICSSMVSGFISSYATVAGNPAHQ